MLKSLKIDLYLDGYSFREIDCVNISVAGSAGYYNYENYYYYCFYYALLKNWTPTKDLSLVEFNNRILNKMGLTIKSNVINDTSKLIAFIKNNIDHNIPLVFVTQYQFLFYSADHMADSLNYHSFIISGYNTRKSLIHIRDSEVVNKIENPKIEQYIKSSPLFKIPLYESMIIDIWERTSKFIKEEHKKSSGHNNTMYSIENANSPIITTYYDLIKDVVENINFKHDNLFEFVENFNDHFNYLCHNIVLFEKYRRDFVNNLNAFIDGIMKGLVILQTDYKKSNEMSEFMNKYRNHRSKVLGKLHANCLRKKVLEYNERNRILDEIKSNNCELFIQINKLYKENLDFINNQQIQEQCNRLMNYAKFSLASADSEYDEPLSDGSSSRVRCKASQAINGRWETWKTDMWSSDALNDMHWLKLDLVEQKNISKFVVRHSQTPILITKDFKIQGSNDDEKWDDLVIIFGNKDSVTKHEIIPYFYRYVRIYITRSCEIDLHARIYEFEIWGDATI